MGSAEITVADVKSMKVAGLREELGKRGLDTTGLKAALQERLEKALEAETLSKELEPLEEPLAVAEEKAAPEATKAEDREAEDPKAASAGPAGDKPGELEKTAAQTFLEKKAARAKKFGLNLELTKEEKAAQIAEKKKERAARFGVASVQGDDFEAKKKARLERFGAAALEPLKRVDKKEKAERKAEAVQKLEKRKERFGDSLDRPLNDFEKKKKARQEKFGTG